MLHDLLPTATPVSGTPATGGLLDLIRGGLTAYNDYKYQSAVRKANVAAIQQQQTLPYPDATGVPAQVQAGSMPGWLPLAVLGLAAVAMSR